MRDYQQHFRTRRKENFIPHDHTLQIVINPFRLSSGASPPMSSQVSSHVNLLLSVNFNFADLVQVHNHYQLAISFTVLTLTMSLTVWFFSSTAPCFKVTHHCQRRCYYCCSCCSCYLTTRLLKKRPNPYKLFLHITKCLHFKFFSLFPVVTLCFLAFMAGCWGMIFH